MTVESKIKDAPRGAPFILFSCALVPVMYWLKWSVKSTGTRYEWSYEWSLNSSTVRLIFWVHSKASLDIPLVLINTNQLAHEWLIHTNWSITHDLFSTWVAESWIPSPIDIYERVRYTNDFKHMNGWVTRTGASLMAESWIASLSDLNHLTLDLLVFSSMGYCYDANNCFDCSNNWFLLVHSLFKEHEPWNRYFPANNIGSKKENNRDTRRESNPEIGWTLSLLLSRSPSTNPAILWQCYFLFTSDSVPSDSK